MPEFIWAVECETSWPLADGRSIDTVIATFTTLEAGMKWLDRLAEKVAKSEGYVIEHRERYILTYSTKNSTNGYVLFQLPLYTEEDIDGSTQQEREQERQGMGCLCFPRQEGERVRHSVLAESGQASAPSG